MLEIVTSIHSKNIQYIFSTDIIVNLHQNLIFHLFNVKIVYRMDCINVNY